MTGAIENQRDKVGAEIKHEGSPKLMGNSATSSVSAPMCFFSPNIVGW
jgi:hypothetical protein